jgi:UMF1 family MFS transporter
MPVLLEQLARENGHFFSDRTKSCLEIPGHVTRRAESGQKEQCMVTLLGKDISTSSFSLYTSSASVLVQAITLVCLSSFADHGKLVLSRDIKLLTGDCRTESQEDAHDVRLHRIRC